MLALTRHAHMLPPPAALYEVSRSEYCIQDGKQRKENMKAWKFFSDICADAPLPLMRTELQVCTCSAPVAAQRK